eukprot:sb/3470324/
MNWNIFLHSVSINSPQDHINRVYTTHYLIYMLYMFIYNKVITGNSFKSGPLVHLTFSCEYCIIQNPVSHIIPVRPPQSENTEQIDTDTRSGTHMRVGTDKVEHAQSVLEAWRLESELQTFCNRSDMSADDISAFKHCVERADGAAERERIHPMVLKHAHQRLKSELAKQWPFVQRYLSDRLLLHKTLYGHKAVKLLLTLLELPVEVC